MNTTNPLQGALLIVLAGIGLGVGYNLVHPDPLPWKAEKKKTVVLVDPSEVDTGHSGAEAAMADPIAVPPSNEGEAAKNTEAAKKDETPKEATKEAAKEPEAPVSEANTTEKAPAKDLYADIPESEFPIEIHLAKTKDLYDRGGLLVLDAREQAEYDEGHITGAVSAYGDQYVGETEWLEKTAKDPRPIMVYCGGGECDLSLNLGFEIARMGHRKVLIFMDGYPAWEEAGYPTEKGEVP